MPLKGVVYIRCKTEYYSNVCRYAVRYSLHTMNLTGGGVVAVVVSSVGSTGTGK